MIDDVEPPEALIEEATLKRLRGSTALSEAELLAEVDELALGEWRRGLDPAVLEYLESAIAGWPDGPSDKEVVDPSRSAEQAMAQFAVPRGYLLGRLLLGTAGQSIWWADDIDAAVEQLEAHVHRMDIALLDTTGVGLAAIESFAESLGFPDRDDLVSLGLIAFDDALAVAALEHDQIHAREGDR